MSLARWSKLVGSLRRPWVTLAALALVAGWFWMLPWDRQATVVTRVITGAISQIPSRSTGHGYHPLETVHYGIVERTETGLVLHFIWPELWDERVSRTSIDDGIEIPRHLWSADCAVLDYDCGPAMSQQGLGMAWWESEGEVIAFRAVRGAWSHADRTRARAMLVDALNAWDPEYLDPSTAPQLRTRDVLTLHIRWGGIAIDLLAMACLTAGVISLRAWPPLIKRWLFIEIHDWQCPECRYDLRGCPDPRCPECGTPRPPRAPR